MVKFRIIAVLLVLDGKIVQSEKFLHTNTIHYDVEIFTSSLNEWCVDEIIVLDVSKKKDHKSFIKNVLKLSKKCFVPLSIGGWVNNYNYAKELFNSGADKIVVNSLLHSNLKLVDKIASKYGVQSIIASVDYSKQCFSIPLFPNISKKIQLKVVHKITLIVKKNLNLSKKS